MNIQPTQIKTLHYLLNSTKLMAEKESLIEGVTSGRSKSSKDLTFQEAGTLITFLKAQDAGHKMRRRITSMAHEMGWKLPGKSAIDMARVNGWCKQYGYLKKLLNDYTNAELPKLVTQFQNGPHKHYLSNL